MELVLQTRATAGRRCAFAASVVFAVLALVLFFPARGSAQEADPAGDLPLAFAPNAGQTDDSVRYVARGAGYSFFFTDEQAVLSLVRTDRQDVTGLALELRFVGASPDARLEAREPASGTVSQLTGAGADSASNVEAYQELVYRQLWPGIDMVFRGDGGELKYEFQLDPGADPRDIRLDYDGASGLSLGSDGGLEIDTPLGVLNDARPVSYQTGDGARVHVDSQYAVHGVDDGGYGFVVDGYDRSRPLVIDPAIDFSTFVGGTGSDAGRGIDVDAEGNIYVTGQTASADYPTTPGVFDRGYNNNTDVFVTKLDSSGSKIAYSTFIGGSAFDSGNGIAVDDAGAAYVAGFSGSLNYPTTPGSFDTTQNGGSDAFVTKLDPSGSRLEYSTYLGGAGFSFEGANGIAVDHEGSAYVTGFTGSAAFPTTPGAFDTIKNGTGNDVYLTKLDPARVRRLATPRSSVGRRATRGTTSTWTARGARTSPGSPPRRTSRPRRMLTTRAITAAMTPSWRGSMAPAPLWSTRPSWEGRALTPGRASPPTKRAGSPR